MMQKMRVLLPLAAVLAGSNDGAVRAAQLRGFRIPNPMQVLRDRKAKAEAKKKASEAAKAIALQLKESVEQLRATAAAADQQAAVDAERHYQKVKRNAVPTATATTGADAAAESKSQCSSECFALAAGGLGKLANFVLFVWPIAKSCGGVAKSCGGAFLNSSCDVLTNVYTELVEKPREEKRAAEAEALRALRAAEDSEKAKQLAAAQLKHATEKRRLLTQERGALRAIPYFHVLHTDKPQRDAFKLYDHALDINDDWFLRGDMMNQPGTEMKFWLSNGVLEAAWKQEDGTTERQAIAITNVRETKIMKKSDEAADDVIIVEGVPLAEGDLNTGNYTDISFRWCLKAASAKQAAKWRKAMLEGAKEFKDKVLEATTDEIGEAAVFLERGCREGTPVLDRHRIPLDLEKLKLGGVKNVRGDVEVVKKVVLKKGGELLVGQNIEQMAGTLSGVVKFPEGCGFRYRFEDSNSPWWTREKTCGRSLLKNKADRPQTAAARLENVRDTYLTIRVSCRLAAWKAGVESLKAEESAPEKKKWLDDNGLPQWLADKSGSAGSRA